MATYSHTGFLRYSEAGGTYTPKIGESVSTLDHTMTETTGGTGSANSTHEDGEHFDDSLAFIDEMIWLGTYTDGGGNVFHLYQFEASSTEYLLAADAPDGVTYPASFMDSELDSNNRAFCFAKDTDIAVPGGSVKVQDLAIGDMICTADGREVAVKWIGRQKINSVYGIAESREPVRIAAGAFGGGVPHRDLTVSADHGMILDGLVVNASAMVTGSTVRFVPLSELEDGFTYYHIETEKHDVILANGAASETFIDIPDRKSFDNYAEYLELYGTERIVPEMRMPRITSQRLLPDTLRARLGLSAASIDFEMLRESA